MNGQSEEEWAETRSAAPSDASLSPGELAIGGLSDTVRVKTGGSADLTPLIVAGLGALCLASLQIAGLAGGVGLVPPVLLVLIASAVQWGAGLALHRETFGEIRRRQPGTATLMTMATSAGWGVSVWQWVAVGEDAGLGLAPTAAVLVFLVLLGRTIPIAADARPGGEGVATDPPLEARRRAGGEGAEEWVPVAELDIGAIILLRSGDTVPVDATVTAGTVEVLAAPVTCDPVPHVCRPGAKVYAGSRILAGAADARAEERGPQSLLGEAGALARAVPLRRGDPGAEDVRMARACLALALVLAPVFGVARGLADPAAGVETALIVLALAYPAGLALYRPLVLVIGARHARAQGIRVHQPQALLLGRSISHLCLGWRGLMTAGRLSVGPVRSDEGTGDAEMLALARAVVGRVDHPLAQALGHAADNAGSEKLSAGGHRYDADRGYSATVAERSILLGTPSLLSSFKVGYRKFSDVADAWLAEGSLVYWLAEAAPERRALGVLAVGDRPRRPIVYALEGLRADAVRTSVLLPYPDRREAEALGNPAGINWIGGRPYQRLETLEALRSEMGPTAVAVTSVTDLPLMNTADLSIASAHAALPVRQAADLTLQSSIPDRLLSALVWLKRYGLSSQRLLWSLLAINGFFMFLVPAGLFFPVLGLLAAGLSVATPAVGLFLTGRPER